MHKVYVFSFSYDFLISITKSLHYDCFSLPYFIIRIEYMICIEHIQQTKYVLTVYVMGKATGQ